MNTSTSTSRTLTNNPGQPYVLNSTESVIPINVAPKTEKVPYWIYLKLRRPTKPELLDRETASTTTLKPKGGGKSLILSNEWMPNVALGRKIALEVKGTTDEDTFIAVREVELENGWLDKAVRGYYAQAARLLFDVKTLFTKGDQKATLRVEHEFGTGELPDYVITWEFNKPDEVTQADYRINSQKIETGGGGRRASSQFITDLDCAERTFDEIFKGVEGAVIAVAKDGGGFELLTYTEERREDFLKAIDPIIKREAVDKVMEFLEGGLSD